MDPDLVVVSQSLEVGKEKGNIRNSVTIKNVSGKRSKVWEIEDDAGRTVAVEI